MAWTCDGAQGWQGTLVMKSTEMGLQTIKHNRMTWYSNPHQGIACSKGLWDESTRWVVVYLLSGSSCMAIHAWGETVDSQIIIPHGSFESGIWLWKIMLRFFSLTAILPRPPWFRSHVTRARRVLAGTFFSALMNPQGYLTSSKLGESIDFGAFALCSLNIANRFPWDPLPRFLYP